MAVSVITNESAKRHERKIEKSAMLRNDFNGRLNFFLKFIYLEVT